ncbi:MAG TPA: M20/M25/M40 family metallo-hydrolase [Solirubrobacteraceae bacterium]|nr:M20/M25/M40 family metallo-hydrolase [Solirubrobacteraceae bacterium]
MSPGGPDDLERRRLHNTFETLCRLETPAGQERPVADWLTRELRDMGLKVEEDDAGDEIGSDSGNLFVRIPGQSARQLLLCAHMDTVPLTAPVEPVLREGGWENAGEGILGADNKSAVAALVETARRLMTGSRPEVGVELLFTIAEETGLNGATAFDVSRLGSEFGYVFDHASPLGEVVLASPSLVSIVADIRGQAAHAGLHPEKGSSAIIAAARALAQMPHGRLDAETTVNVGTVTGGTATNVVAERCRVELEVRAVDAGRVEEVVTTVIDAFQDAVDASACDLDVTTEKLFTGYRLRPTEPAIELAGRALSAIGYRPEMISSGGGSDANAFRAAGFACVNLANGTERAHQPTERVSVQALEGGLELVLALLDEAAA